MRWTGQRSCSKSGVQGVSGNGESTGSPLTISPLPSRLCPLLAVEWIERRPLWAQPLELPEPAMQPLPAGAFLEEVAEEIPAQSESEPKVLDPEEDLLCIAKTFSYLRESGESEDGGRPCLGKSERGSFTLPVKSDLRGMALPRTV